MNVKTSLNLAYKIVNYVFDSEISQTAGAGGCRLTQGVGGSGKKYIQAGKRHPRGCLRSTSSTTTTFTTKSHKPTSQLLFLGFYVQPWLSGSPALRYEFSSPFRKLGHTVYNHQRERARSESTRMCKSRL